MNFINKSKKYIFSNSMINILIVLFIMNELLMGLIKGGRFNLNPQIALGERLIDGTLKYSSGISDLFITSSPYFPGVGILSSIYQILGVNNIYILNQIMIFSAIIIGLTYFEVLKRMTKLLFPQIPKRIIVIILFLFLITHFDLYKYYLSEFKPDTILLVISGFIFFLLSKNGVNNPLKFISTLFLLFISAFFKQSAFLVFFLALLLIVFSKNISRYRKIFYSLFVFIVGISAISIIFNIENCFLYTVEMMSQHGFYNKYTIFSFIRDTFNQNPIYCCVLFMFLLSASIKIFRSNYSNNKLIYLGFSTVWFSYNIIGMCKIGGNLGNSEVALIPFMPFVINEIYIQFSNVNVEKFQKISVKYFVIPLSIYLSIIMLNQFRLFINYTTDNIAAIKYLNNNFKDKKAFIDTYAYPNASTAGLKVISDSHTSSSFFRINSDYIKPFAKIFQNQYYDLLYIKFFDKLYNRPYSEEMKDVIEKHYYLLESSDLPKSLKGQIFLPMKSKG